METITSVPTPPGSRGHFAGAPRAVHNQRWRPVQLQTCRGHSPRRRRAPAPRGLSRGDSHHGGLVAAPPRAPSTTVRGLCPREGTSNPRDVPASRTASDEVTAPRAQAPGQLALLRFCQRSPHTCPRNGAHAQHRQLEGAVKSGSDGAPRALSSEQEPLAGG